MFKSTQNKGFQMTFKNGLTISIQFGSTNYCEARDKCFGIADEMNHKIWQSASAEIAIWDEDNEFYDFGSDVVKGYVNADEVADWIRRVTEARSIDDLMLKVHDEEYIKKFYEDLKQKYS